MRTGTASHPKRSLPPPAPPEARKTRDVPDLSLCHGCGLRCTPTSTAGPLRVLESQWRVVLLCPPCLARLHSSAACSYCFSDLAPLRRAFFDCRRCRRCVHLGCLSLLRGFVTLSELDPRSFVCVDCSAIPSFRINPEFHAALNPWVDARRTEEKIGDENGLGFLPSNGRIACLESGEDLSGLRGERGKLKMTSCGHMSRSEASRSFCDVPSVVVNSSSLSSLVTTPVSNNEDLNKSQGTSE